MSSVNEAAVPFAQQTERVAAASPCPICDAQREIAFTAMLLAKYQVTYFLCGSCGLLQTETPYWLEETYDLDMGDFDTDLAARNLYCSRRLAGLFYFLFGRDGKYLDFAGGYGLLTRLMRDIGFDCYWTDPYSKNLYAKGFEAENGPSEYTVVTAFEVLEHVADPVELVSRLRRDYRCEALIFSTQVFAGKPPQPGKWAYYGLDGGQHISFYQLRTLDTLARRVGARFYSHGRIHAIVWRPLSALWYRLLTGRASVFIDLYVRSRMQSRTSSDQRLIPGNLRSRTTTQR